MAFYEWKSGKSSVGVLIFIKASAKEASDTLEGFPEVLDINKLTEQIQGLGDGSYLWEAQHTKGEVGADFWKDRVAVHVAAFSLDDAKLFAQHIADEISGK